MRDFLWLGAVTIGLGCGGADFKIDGGVDGSGDGPAMGEGGGDGGGPDTCSPRPEICGNAMDEDCDGVPDNGCKGLGTYVDLDIGIDTNPGTQKAPVKTIKQGIMNAVTIGGTQTVYVADGHYSEKVTLTEGVSLEGGYQCDMQTCTWNRNPAMYDTAIMNQDFEGVLAPANITGQTRIDGFRVQGMNGAPPTPPGSVCITVLGSPTIRGNRINGGMITGGAVWNSRRTTGIAILAPIADPAGPLIDNNDIQGGDGGAYVSTGILFGEQNNMTNVTSYGLVRNNRIKGGPAQWTSGIEAWSSAGQTTVELNTITAGKSSGSGGGGGSWAIDFSSILRIDGNLINTDQSAVGGCTTPGWCGGIASWSSTSTIVNNVIYGSKSPMSAAVFLVEAEMAAGIVILNSNVLDGAGSGPNPNLATRSAALALRVSFGVNAKLGRVRNNVMQGGINQLRYGVWEDQVPNKTNKPEVLEFNNFFFPPLMGRTDSYWHQWNGTMATDMLSTPPNNQSGDPLLDATWHLTGNSPCIDKGTATEAPNKDRDGQARPMGGGFDIGADEK